MATSDANAEHDSNDLLFAQEVVRVYGLEGPQLHIDDKPKYLTDQEWRDILDLRMRGRPDLPTMSTRPRHPDPVGVMDRRLRPGEFDAHYGMSEATCAVCSRTVWILPQSGEQNGKLSVVCEVCMANRALDAALKGDMPTDSHASTPRDYFQISAHNRQTRRRMDSQQRRRKR